MIDDIRGDGWKDISKRTPNNKNGRHILYKLMTPWEALKYNVKYALDIPSVLG